MEPWGTGAFVRIFKRGTFMWNLGTWTFKSGTLMWNLGQPGLFRVEPWFGTFGTWALPLCGTLRTLEPGVKNGTFMWNLVEPQLFRAEPLCGTLWNLNFQWNLDVEPCGSWTFGRGTWWSLNFQQWNLDVEPCGTSTFNSGTCMWNLNF